MPPLEHLIDLGRAICASPRTPSCRPPALRSSGNGRCRRRSSKRPDTARAAPRRCACVAGLDEMVTRRGGRAQRRRRLSHRVVPAGRPRAQHFAFEKKASSRKSASSRVRASDTARDRRRRHRRARPRDLGHEAAHLEELVDHARIARRASPRYRSGAACPRRHCLRRLSGSCSAVAHPGRRDVLLKSGVAAACRRAARSAMIVAIARHRAHTARRTIGSSRRPTAGIRRRGAECESVC